jgi:UDP-glucuronate decarboxylase
VADSRDYTVENREFKNNSKFRPRLSASFFSNSESGYECVLRNPSNMRSLSLKEGLLLTGGTGFFGTAVLKRLGALALNRPTKVTVLSRNPEVYWSRQQKLAVGSNWIRGDILSPRSLPTSSRFTYILHAAADSTLGPRKSPLSRFTQILEGTRNVLELALVTGAKRLLFVSSGAIYGEQYSGRLGYRESDQTCPDPLDQNCAYGIGKLAAEHLCALYAKEHGLEIVIARCFAFVGEDLPLNVHFAIGNFIRDALWADEIVVVGDGKPIRSYLDQRDLAHWLLTLLYEGRAGEAYNVGSDRAISIADLAHLVRDLVSPGKPVRILGEPLHNAERSLYVPDISKIHKHLAIQPTFTLEQSILDAAATARAQGKLL